MSVKGELRRLRLKPGDVIVVKDQETAQALMDIRDWDGPKCPIVIAEHGIGRVSLSYLEKIVAEAKKCL